MTTKLIVLVRFWRGSSLLRARIAELGVTPEVITRESHEGVALMKKLQLHWGLLPENDVELPVIVVCEGQIIVWAVGKPTDNDLQKALTMLAPQVVPASQDVVPATRKDDQYLHGASVAPSARHPYG